MYYVQVVDRKTTNENGQYYSDDECVSGALGFLHSEMDVSILILIYSIYGAHVFFLGGGEHNHYFIQFWQWLD